MNLVDVVAEGIWKGFELEDNACVDRTMDLIDTGGTYESFSMTRVASVVIRHMQSEGAILVRNDWREHMRSMLGKQVRVTLDEGPEPVFARGQLLSFDEGGEVALRTEEGFVRYCWPNLSTEPI